MNGVTEEANEVEEKLSNPMVKRFLEDANEVGLGFEAAFIVALADSGKELMKKCRINKDYRDQDDLMLAYMLVEFHRQGQQAEFCKGNYSELQTFGKVVKLAKDMCAKLNLEKTHWKIEAPDQIMISRLNERWNKVTSYGVYNMDPIDVRTNRKMAIIQLRTSFYKAFAGQNLLISQNTQSGTKFFSRTEMKEVKIPSYLRNHFRLRPPDYPMVALQIKNKDDQLKADFLCTTMHHLTDIDYFMKVSTHQIKVGVLVANELISQPKAFLGRNPDGFIIVSKYKPETADLSLLCSEEFVLPVIRENICRRVQHIAEQEIPCWNVLNCWMEYRKTMVTFGPGFSVRSIIPNTNIDQFVYTIRAKQTPSTVHNANFTDFFKTFSNSQKCAPLMFNRHGEIFLTFETLEYVQEFKRHMSTSKFEPLVESLFTYMLSSEATSCSSTPAAVEEDCIICLTPPKGDSIRLSMCGHLYCDDCFIKLIENAEQFPIKCAAELCQLISVQDMRVVLSRNFDDIDSFHQFIMPVLNRSLEAFVVSNHTDYICCLTINCNHLMKKQSGVKISCPVCKSIRCGGCGDGVHDEITCDSNRKSKFLSAEDSLRSWVNEKGDQCRICPNIACSMLIERMRDGCNHFRCPKCQIHFCWICENVTANHQKPIYDHMTEAHGGFGLHEWDWVQVEQAMAVDPHDNQMGNVHPFVRFGLGLPDFQSPLSGFAPNQMALAYERTKDVFTRDKIRYN